ncbi:lysine-rich coiled-coil protein 1 [Discoglossus pictus]
MASEGGIIPQLVECITQSSPSANCSVPMAGGDISNNAHTTIPCHKEMVLDEQTKKELFTDTFCKVCGAVLQFECHRISHYEGKKHAQRVRLYFQKNEQEELSVKKQKLDRVDFHVDGGGAFDKNKFCNLCNMVFSSPVVAQSHYVGKTHAKKMRQIPEHVQGVPQTDETEPVPPMQTETAAPPVPEACPPHPPPVSEKAPQEESSTEQISIPDNDVDLNDPDKYCKLCCASFNKPMVAQQHYNGKKHLRNEARRKMMEEMEETGVPVEPSASDGKFVCPICSVTLTSIEMYQSHMQGNKHHVKESMVANLMKTSKKAYDSFQDELADYIKVQKARGLEPKTQFKTRQDKDQYDSGEYDEEEFEGRPPPGHANPTVPYKYYEHQSMPYPPYNAPHPANNRVPAWPPHWENVGKPLNSEKVQYFNTQSAQHRAHTPSSLDSSDDYKGSSSDESSGSFRKDRKHKRKYRKEGKHRGGRLQRDDESVERKKRRTEDIDKLESDKGKKESTDKSKHRKEKKKKEEQTVDKESKKHKKGKKEEDPRTEEEILWDESILGF